VVEHTGKPLTAADRSIADSTALGSNEQFGAARLMWPFEMIVRNVFIDERTRMPFAKRHAAVRFSLVMRTISSAISV
jgi:hypothetical protein